MNYPVVLYIIIACYVIMALVLWALKLYIKYKLNNIINGQVKSNTVLNLSYLVCFIFSPLVVVISCILYLVQLGKHIKDLMDLKKGS